MDALPTISTRSFKSLPVVLIVESDFLVRWRAAEYLRDRNYTIIEATDVLEAIGLLASGTPVDVVVSDASLSDELNQTGLAEWFRKNHPRALLLLTSSDRTDHPESAGSEPDRFIAKPYKLDDLHLQIQSMLSRF